MDETEYRSAYRQLNPVRCVFEKAINSRNCNCSKSTRFNLADREGVSCNDPKAQQICDQLLVSFRENARFVFQLSSVSSQLPHNAEIKTQAGGIKGLVKLLDNADETDIFSAVSSAIEKYDSISAFPYSEIVKEISSYQTRRKRKK